MNFSKSLCFLPLFVVKQTICTLVYLSSNQKKKKKKTTCTKSAHLSRKEDFSKPVDLYPQPYTRPIDNLFQYNIHTHSYISSPDSISSSSACLVLIKAYTVPSSRQETSQIIITYPRLRTEPQTKLPGVRSTDVANQPFNCIQKCVIISRPSAAYVVRDRDQKWLPRRRRRS